MTAFIIEQKITAFANQYRVFGADNEGVKQNLISFAHQKRLAFREKVEFFNDEERKSLAFSVKAEKVMDIHGKFIVRDSKDKPIGQIRKAFKSSLLRSTWEILDKNDQVMCLVRERSQALAIIRRVWGWLPYLGDIPFFIRYHFDFVQPETEKLLATYVKTTRLRDHYRLDIRDANLLTQAGWQTLVTQAVLMDALQGR